MIRSIDSLDPNRMTTVKDLYCLYRVGKPRLELLGRHRNRLINLNFNPLELYNRVLTDLTLEELKIIVILTLDRIGSKSMFDRNGKISIKSLHVFDVFRVYECLSSTLYGKKFKETEVKDANGFCGNYNYLLKGLNKNNLIEKLEGFEFYCPPENYPSHTYYNTYSFGGTTSTECINIEGLKPQTFKESRRGTYIKSRPFREDKLYPFIEETRTEYRIRDLMYGLDQNTCNAWLKRTRLKYKVLKISEEKLMNFLHKPVHSITEEDISMGRKILNLYKTESFYINFFNNNIDKLKECQEKNWGFHPNRSGEYYEPTEYNMFQTGVNSYSMESDTLGFKIK